MDRPIRLILVTLVMLACAWPASASLAPKQTFIPEKKLDVAALEQVKTIALLEVPDPEYYFFGEGIGFLTGVFGIVGSIAETMQYGKDSAQYGEFSFGKTAQAYLKQFLQENGYQVIEYSPARDNAFGLIDDYGSLEIEAADAYLDVAAVVVGYKQNEANVFNDSRSGPHVSTVARLVSARTKQVIYAGSVQYGWDMNPLVSGIKIDAPQDHKYETKEDLKAHKEQAIARLVRGIEAVSLNIAMQITSGDFVSVMSPTMEDVMGEEVGEVSIEFIGVAANEIASKTWDERLWRQSGELAGGDANQHSAIYIKLRSKQLAAIAKREAKREAQRDLAQQAVEGEIALNLTGTYRAHYTSRRRDLVDFKGSRMEVKLSQEGQNVTGTFGVSGKIWGVVKDRSVEFGWFSGGSQGSGEWQVDVANNGLRGSWSQGEWDMEKIDSAPIAMLIEPGANAGNRGAQTPADISGTYEARIVTKRRDIRDFGDQVVVRLAQEGDKITGSFGNTGKIWGNLQGKKIDFDWFSGGKQGSGSWQIDPANNSINGTFSHGEWNMLKTD